MAVFEVVTGSGSFLPGGTKLWGPQVYCAHAPAHVHTHMHAHVHVYVKMEMHGCTPSLHHRNLQCLALVLARVGTAE